jgi:diketogulonate reductase-like aldo/keto reductase
MICSYIKKSSYLTFRNNGKHMPAFGLGTWQSKPNEVYDAVLTAIKAG